MKITKEMTDELIFKELGDRLAKARLDHNLTQVALATEAGVSKRMLERLESGTISTQLSAFVRICRALNLIDRLDMLVPAPVPSPIAQLKFAGKRRKRASGKRTGRRVKKEWTWGDES
jgi:transcriptional regulator with XRE-family HTH domain